MVIGNFGMNFRPGPKQDRTQDPQMKNGNPRLLPTSQKIKTIFDFFLIIMNMVFCLYFCEALYRQLNSFMVYIAFCLHLFHLLL